MRALVVVGTGFPGGAIAEAAVAAGHEVARQVPPEARASAFALRSDSSRSRSSACGRALVSHDVEADSFDRLARC